LAEKTLIKKQEAQNFVMNQAFWLDKDCPICERGRLFVSEDATNQRLHLHCEECECARLNPVEDTADKSFPAINPDFKARMSSTETIQNFGWTKYKLKTQ
jgi:hypothetical protein